MHARSVVLVVAVLGSCATLVPAAAAESHAACAQRVIRDWYSGGRVDRVYPLPCYRAAIRALPADVLQYSDADRDIARALAFARRGRTDPGNGKAVSTTPLPSPGAGATAPAEPSAPAETTAPATAPKAPADTAPASPPTSPARPAPARLASGPDATTVGGGLPYPILALALLAGILLSTAAVGWLASLARRR